jgi:hypothetical protein
MLYEYVAGRKYENGKLAINLRSELGTPGLGYV